MTMHFRELAEQAMADGRISPEEILSLRREGWSDGAISREEAEALFVINAHLAERSPEWVDAFVEAIVEHLVDGGNPRGYIAQVQADWLVAQVDSDGKVESVAELELLAKLFERAEFVPESLKSYASGQIERIVLTGSGPTRDGGQLDAGSITDAECRLLRRFIFAMGSGRPGAVSQQEAEMLFRIKDATLGAANSAEWRRLFVQGVGNFLQGWSMGVELAPERAVALEAFMNDNTPGIGRFFGRMVTTRGLEETVDRALHFGRKGAQVEPPVHHDSVDEARAVTPIENVWLQAQMNANGQIDELEQALLDFLAEDAG